MTDVEAMATLQGNRTGLENILVWISKRNPRHACYVKVSNQGNTYSPNDNFSLDLEGNIQEGDSKLSTAELNQVQRWIKLNQKTIERFWTDDQYLDDEMKKHIKRIPKK